MDLTYKKAVRNDSIPFEQYVSTCTSPSAPRIDAVYIPTQSHRPIPETSARVLQNHAASVHLLFSGNAADWVKDIDHSQVHIHEGLQAQRATSRLVYDSARNPSAQHQPKYDIPYKRNLSVLHAFTNAHRTICLLDDDTALDDEDFHIARQALQDGVDIGSFHVLDYPDVSTVDHMERIVRQRPSRVSIGGNCLFMKTESIASFFPDAYNDDWFFIFSHMPTKRIATLGTARQRPYAPWMDLDRIAFEQFGDIIIEGAKSNIAAGRAPFTQDEAYWDATRQAYLNRLEALLAMPESAGFAAQFNHAATVARQMRTSDLMTFIDAYASERAVSFQRELTTAANGPDRRANILQLRA